MLDFLSEPEAKIVLGITAVLIITSIAVWLVLNIRGHAEQDMPDLGDHLTYFREMHEQGALDDDEFRRVKAELSETLHAEAVRESKEESSTEQSMVRRGPHPDSTDQDA